MSSTRYTFELSIDGSDWKRAPKTFDDVYYAADALAGVLRQTFELGFAFCGRLVLLETPEATS